jgi:ABC-type bacteriocin/lantibiotic exporter with double-glycine peptidase domain
MISQATQFLPQAADAVRYVSDSSGEDLRRAVEPRGDERKSRAPAPSPPSPPVGAESGPVDRTDPIGPAIELRALGYRYPGASRDALSGITIGVAAGEQMVVVGPSGSGKSTLLAMVLGLAKPARGTVAVDGSEPSEFLRRAGIRVGYVGAEPFLVAGSLEENLRYGLARAVDAEEIGIALRRARLEDVVSRLPDGLGHSIREDGAGLSAGQKQRLCLARAFLNRPHLLVLDEITANLDAATEGEIVESLKELRGRCTTVIVSHRHALLKYADRVLRLSPAEDERTSEDAS